MTDFRIGLNPPDTGWVASVCALLVAAFMAARWWAGWRQRNHRFLYTALTFTVVFLALVSILPWVSEWARRASPLAVMLIAAIAWAIKGYAEAAGSGSRLTRGSLALLRIMTIVVVFGAFLRPVAGWREERRVRPTLMIIRDASRSMTIADVPRETGGFEPRGKVVRRRLGEVSPKVDELRASWDVVNARFSDAFVEESTATTRRVDEPDDGAATVISRALTDSLASQTDVDRQLGAILLISDGAENVDGDVSSISAARSLAAAGVALYTVGVGSPLPMGDTRTILARALIAPDRASAGTRVSITADFECLGFAGEPVDVELLWEGEGREKQTIVPKAVSESVRVVFEVDARPAGFRAVEVRARPRRGANDANTASLSKFIQVTDDALQVLLVESRPRSESAFIARALAGEKRLRLTRMYLSRPPEGDWTNPLPAVREAWRDYQVVLFGDVTRAEAGDRRLQGLLQAVEKDGVGLAILGGLSTPNARSLLVGPLANAVPVRRPERSDKPGSGRILPTPIGTGHPVCDTSGAGAGAGAWEKLAFLPTDVTLGRTKPAAQVLLTDEDKKPVLAVQNAGQGRTAAMAVDATWRWAMQSDEGAELHRRFWRQLVLWLAGKPVRVHIASDRPRYDLAQVRPGTAGVRVDAYIFDGSGSETTASQTATVTLIPPEGQETQIVMQRDEGRWVGRAFVQQAGTYSLRLKAEQGGKPVGQAESRFTVEDVDRELREPLANLDLLRSLSAETAAVGGRYIGIDGLGEILDALKKDVARQTRVERRTIDLTIDGGPFWLAAVLMLLTLEWSIRKRCGMV